MGFRAALWMLASCLILLRCSTDSTYEPPPEDTPNIPMFRLLKATGHLRIPSRATGESYQVYFHIPIAFEDQVPVHFQIESEQLLDYRFVRLAPPNALVSATMRSTPGTTIVWESWVLVKPMASLNLPETIPIPARHDWPEFTTKWLASTSCVQVDAPIVQGIAAQVSESVDDLKQLSDNIGAYCRDAVPGGFAHEPMGFSAVYALKFGNSCTGHAHAGAALFRANDVPSRILLNILTDYPSPMDMHWIVDYFLPNYGWVKMEPSLGINYLEPHRTIVVMVCEPEYENPLFYPNGIDSYWYSSDPAVGIPDWRRAHLGVTDVAFNVPEDRVQQLFALAVSVWDKTVDLTGLNLADMDRDRLDEARGLQAYAVEVFPTYSWEAALVALEDAHDVLLEIDVDPIKTIYFNDFEGDANGWIHGGLLDEWELGTPDYASAPFVTAYSGEACWATDLDGNYEDNADFYLMSPPIDLANLSCAYLRVFLRNSLQGDDLHHVFEDPLWMEITIDGERFTPLCTHMGGRNDDPEIYDEGGWGFLSLDLTPYVDNTIRIRFRLTTNAEGNFEGVHIDDFHVMGRQK